MSSLMSHHLQKIVKYATACNTPANASITLTKTESESFQSVNVKCLIILGWPKSPFGFVHKMALSST